MLRRTVWIAALVAAAVAATGCGERDPSPAAAASSDVKPVGDESAGSVVQFADCADWNAGSVEERRVTVERIRGQLTPQSSASAASPLSDERAYAIFEKACAQDYAASLRLYKLYARAQGFAPLSE